MPRRRSNHNVETAVAMAAQGSDDVTGNITTERDLFWAAVKEEADVEGSSRPAPVHVKEEPVDCDEVSAHDDEMSTHGDVPSGNVDVRLSPIEEVFVDQTAVKTEPDIGSQKEGGGVLPSSPALEEKETQGQSQEPPLKLPFKCHICRMGFPDKQRFLQHVLTHIGLPPVAKCPHCPAAFKSTGELEQHSLRHSSKRNRAALGGASVGHPGSKPSEAPTRLAPPFAGKSLRQETHPSVPPPPSDVPNRPAGVSDPPRNSGAHKCRAAGCGKRYTTWRNLRRHVLYRARNNPPAAMHSLPCYDGIHACAVCSRRFVDTKGLASHAHVHCLDEECPTCGQQFRTKARLAAHRLTHAARRPFKCGACARTFSCKASLERHVKTHPRVARHECGECGRRYHRPSRLAAHKLAHAAIKPWLCEECGRGFASRGSLKYHAAWHTGEKPFECDTCGKRFARKQTIELHCRRHTGDKPYGCEACGKRFAVKMTLEAHRRTHTGERPFQCPVPTCGKRFKHAFSLKLHSRKCRLVLPV